MARRAKANLTDTLVGRAKPEASQYRIWDVKVSGFGVQVFPSGARSFVVQFTRGGAKVFLTIGTYPSWSAAKAREEAYRLRQLHEEGRDVKAFLEVERQPNTIASLVEIWRTDYAPRRKPTTLSSYESILKTCIIPRLGDRLVRDISHGDIRAFYRAIKAKTPTQAGRACAILSKLFNIAEREQWRPPGSNPVKGLEREIEHPKTRVLTIDELRRLELAIVYLAETGWKSKKYPNRQPFKLEPVVADLVRFLAFSGLRRSEALTLRWDALDLAKGTMTFAEHKTDQHGAKVLPINAQLQSVLTNRMGQSLSVYVFSGLSMNKPFQGFGKLWLKIAEKAGLVGVTPHDLRRTFNTTCAELGYPPQVFDTLLGHRLPGMQAIYTHLNPTGILAEASKATSTWIEAAMLGKNPRTGESVRSLADTGSA